MDIQRYKRGQIWWLIDTNPKYDTTEQAGTRPAIIISNDSANRFSDNITVIPCTTAIKKDLPVHVKLEINDSSTALAENIITVSKQKIGAYIGTIDDKLMIKIDEAIKVSLGLVKLAYETEQENETNLILEVKQSHGNKSEIGETERKTAGRKKISLADKIRFVNDSENHDYEYMMKKYNIKTKPAVRARIYDYKKAIQEAS